MALKVFHTGDLHLGMLYMSRGYPAEVRQELVEARFRTLDFDQNYYPVQEEENVATGLDFWFLGHTHVRLPVRDDTPQGGRDIDNPYRRNVGQILEQFYLVRELQQPL